MTENHADRNVCPQHAGLMTVLGEIKQGQKELWNKLNEIQRTGFETQIKQATANGYARGCEEHSGMPEWVKVFLPPFLAAALTIMVMLIAFHW